MAAYRLEIRFNDENDRVFMMSQEGELLSACSMLVKGAALIAGYAMPDTSKACLARSQNRQYLFYVVKIDGLRVNCVGKICRLLRLQMQAFAEEHDMGKDEIRVHWPMPVLAGRDLQAIAT